MIIERNKDEIIFRLPADTDISILQEIAEFLEFSQIASKSKATQKDVDELVKKIKKGRWEKTRKNLGQ